MDEVSYEYMKQMKSLMDPNMILSPYKMFGTIWKKDW